MVTDDKLTAFLYTLLRDHITFGEVEKMLHEDAGFTEFTLSERDQARYARRLAEKLTEKES